MTRHFFSESDLDDFLRETGVKITWVDSDGALRGTKDDPVYGRFVQSLNLEKDDVGGNVPFQTTLLTLKTTDVENMRNNTEITIDEPPNFNEKWLVRKSDAEITGDGNLMLVPVEEI